MKQGDPLSPVLFNLVLDGALAEVSEIWKKRGYGTDVGYEFRGHRLTHIAFADDQTLIAKSWLSMKKNDSDAKGGAGEEGPFIAPYKVQGANQQQQFCSTRSSAIG